jgi:hypothetical protein
MKCTVALTFENFRLGYLELQEGLRKMSNDEEATRLSPGSVVSEKRERERDKKILIEPLWS